jgi:hypothetical protein
MKLFACLVCRLALRIVGDAAEEARLLEPPAAGFTCPGCDAPVAATADPEVLHAARVVDLTPEEAYAALHGLGLPEEQDCRADRVALLLRERPVRRVVARDLPGSRRAVLESIELWDGTLLHLGAAPEGAVVFRVSRRPS